MTTQASDARGSSGWTEFVIVFVIFGAPASGGTVEAAAALEASAAAAAL